MGNTTFEYVKVTGFLDGKDIGHVLPDNDREDYTGHMGKELERNIPIISVDGFELEAKVGGRTKRKTSVDLTFIDKRGDKSEVVSAIRLTELQVEELATKLRSIDKELRSQESDF